MRNNVDPSIIALQKVEHYVLSTCYFLRTHTPSIKHTAHLTPAHASIIHAHKHTYVRTYVIMYVRTYALHNWPGGGGGGGALGYLGGRKRSLSKLENTPKALISGRKSTLI